MFYNTDPHTRVITSLLFNLHPPPTHTSVNQTYALQTNTNYFLLSCDTRCGGREGSNCQKVKGRAAPLVGDGIFMSLPSCVAVLSLIVVCFLLFFSSPMNEERNLNIPSRCLASSPSHLVIVSVSQAAISIAGER